MKLSEYLLDRIFSLICMLAAALVLLALLWLMIRYNKLRKLKRA